MLNINVGDFVSSIFTRTKKDGSHRMILNLKILNTFNRYSTTVRRI